MKKKKCVGCVATKLKTNHKFPIRCPVLRMPCVIIKSSIIMNDLANESYRRSFIATYINGIENTNFDVLDKNLINYMKSMEEKVIQNKGKIDYTEYGVDGNIIV